ncbi:formyltetrahydrofolate deformylase [Solicola sp. PLA-1-18]|uniref:formyltetrahydrofolate deformylase n=1 Tax=Solicola sp. PLA-1-18 TaxID=3380532 RepID=UPI003B797E77
MTTYVLTIRCLDRPGLVHAVAAFLEARGADIVESQQFDDPLGHEFYMRLEFRAPGEADGGGVEALRSDFGSVASLHQMTWSLVDSSAPCRTLVMVSKFGHCLNDLVFRHSTGALNVEIPAIVSNHRDHERLAQLYDIPFHHVPVTPETKPEAEAEMLRLVDDLDIDLVVLARYMQVLSDETSKQLEGRTINIHHSFLPSFKGAKPYHQAFDRGVKLIGATAHYVTSDLDEGPIIEQDVVRVDHRMTPEQMVRAGRDVEAVVLSRAVAWHAESRLLLGRGRVVVFP